MLNIIKTQERDEGDSKVRGRSWRNTIFFGRCNCHSCLLMTAISPFFHMPFFFLFLWPIPFWPPYPSWRCPSLQSKKGMKINVCQQLRFSFLSVLFCSPGRLLLFLFAQRKKYCTHKLGKWREKTQRVLFSLCVGKLIEECGTRTQNRRACLFLLPPIDQHKQTNNKRTRKGIQSFVYSLIKELFSQWLTTCNKNQFMFESFFLRPLT